MNRAFLILITLILILSCGYKEKRCECGLSRGVLSKDWVYTNDSMKLKMQLPRDWNIIIGMSYAALSKDNDDFYTNDYVYSNKDIEQSKNSPIYLIDDLFRITKADPKDMTLDGPTIRFRLTKSSSSKHTAKEDIEQMIRDYEKAKDNIDNNRAKLNYSELVNTVNLPQGNTFHYFFFNNNMDNKQVAIGIIHKDCYNLKIEIGADNYRLLQQTVNDFSNYWLEY